MSKYSTFQKISAAVFVALIVNLVFYFCIGALVSFDLAATFVTVSFPIGIIIFYSDIKKHYG